MRAVFRFDPGARRRRLFTWGAIASFGVVAAGVTIRSAVVDQHARELAVTSHVDVAAACGCARARVVGPTGMHDVVFERVREPSDDDSNQIYPGSKTSFVATWLADEALLPAASYVMSYRVGDQTARSMVRSEGARHDLAVRVVAPEKRDGFVFVGGGACGDGDARVEPFLLAAADLDAASDWSSASYAALHHAARLPTSDELRCAAALGYLDARSWRWAGSTADDDPRVVRGVTSRPAQLDGLASVRLVRPVASAGDVVIHRATIRLSSRANETTSTRGPYPIDLDSIRILAADLEHPYVVLRGNRCLAAAAIKVLEGAGITSSRMLVGRTDDDAQVASAVVLASEPHGTGLAPATSLRDTECGRVVITDTTAPELLDPIEFDPGAATVRPASLPIVAAVASTLNGNPSILRVEVQSHVFDGPRQRRLDLSELRARAIEDLLVARGVERSRLTSAGYGDTQPLGCPPDLAAFVKAHTAVATMRASDAWSAAAEAWYVSGELDEQCSSAAVAHETRIEFLILQRKD